jgi:xylulose-5-phosphate/fructose-6-phosphate phosphoketolase
MSFFTGLGYEPLLVEGSEPQSMHQAMAATLDYAFDRIEVIRKEGKAERARWPLVILRSPKGWTGPHEVDGLPVEGTFRSHQVPLSGLAGNPAHLAQLEAWLKSYKPEELFDSSGAFRAELKVLAPSGTSRMSARPEANGGLIRRPLRLGDYRQHAVKVEKPGVARSLNTGPLGRFLRDIMRDNPQMFRVFGPDETSSNKLHALYEVTGKTWLAERLPTDDQGGHLAADGRVMEILSEHTLEGWLEGYLLTGRAGSLTYASKALATSPPCGGSNDKRPPGWKYNVLDTAFVGGQAASLRHSQVPVSKTWASGKTMFVCPLRKRRQKGSSISLR